MPQFISADDPLISDLPTSIIYLPYHECAHLFCAYFYGYQIGGFRFFRHGADTGASVSNRRSPAIDAMNSQLAACNEARKLLAGEIAARIKAKLPTDRIVLSLHYQQAEALTPHTPFADIDPDDPRIDGVRVLGLFRFNYDKPGLPDNWWDWVWDRHSETEELLRSNWCFIEKLVKRVKGIRKFDTWGDWWTGQRPLGAADGETLIGWCESLRLPVNDPAFVSQPYVPAE